MNADRTLLAVSAVLQGTAALTFGLVFFGLWRAFERRSAVYWTIAWLVYGIGVLNTASGLLFRVGVDWPAAAQGLLSLPLLFGVLLFRAGTMSVVHADRRPITAGAVAVFAAVAIGTVLARVADASGRIPFPSNATNFVLPRLIMGGGYLWAAWPLLRARVVRRSEGVALMRFTLVALSVRMFVAAAYESLQIARGVPQQPESPVLTVAQLSLLIVFGIATAVVLIDAERAEQSRLEGALLQAQRIDSLGYMSSGIAHDFNNTLQAIMTGLEMAAEEASSGEPIAQRLADVSEAAERGAALTRQLLTFARGQDVSPKPFDAGARVAGLQRLLTAVLGRAIKLQVVRTSDPCVVCVDPAQFDQVVLNLTINARDAMPDGGRLTIRIGLEPAGAGGASTVRLDIEDTGAGIPAAVLPHVFEPFFTTKAAGRGTGLGLSTAYHFARHAGGSLSVESRPGAGSRFYLDLPAMSSPVMESS
jgi:signal transduction histidine kinase